MLFAVYAGAGGVLYPALGCAGGVGVLAWVGYWLARGGARGPVTPFGRLAVWVGACSVVIVAVCLPPLRRAGDWRAEPSGEPIAPAAVDALDRDYFGWVPRFMWVGAVGTEEAAPPGVIVQLRSGVRGRCDRCRWVIDGSYAAAEVVCFGLLILPLARARRRDACAEPVPVSGPTA